MPKEPGGYSGSWWGGLPCLGEGGTPSGPEGPPLSSCADPLLPYVTGPEILGRHPPVRSQRGGPPPFSRAGNSRSVGSPMETPAFHQNFSGPVGGAGRGRTVFGATPLRGPVGHRLFGEGGTCLRWVRGVPHPGSFTPQGFQSEVQGKQWCFIRTFPDR